jgi:phosphoadenosine phosphosulfate reductase
MADAPHYPDLIALKKQAEALNAEFAGLDADGRLRRAYELFGDRLIATTSFGRDAALLLHHLHRLNIRVRIYFMDTGFHFPETLSYRDTLAKSWSLDIRTVSSDRPELERRQYAVTDAQSETGPDGKPRIRITDIDACCAINKVEVQRQFLALPDVEAFVSGLRRDQSEARKDMPFVAVQRGKIKVMPFLDWPHEDVDLYLRLREVPEHPLAHLGYTSIGCGTETCTRTPLPGEDSRSGRWAGASKTECGIHLDTGDTDFGA